MPQPIPFRHRAHEVSRIEAFSDVVFGFALTLIVVSLEVPRTYAELVHEMRGFIGFAICFATLTWVWHEHHRFFRRYGLQDELTIVLNTVLLFLVLFYIYPLKFMFELVTRRITSVGAENGRELFLIYGLGFAGIFAVFALMHVHAYRKREQLELNALEVHDTLGSLAMYVAYVAIGLLSIGIAYLVEPRRIGLAGWTYFLLGPVSAAIGHWRGSRRARIAVPTVAA
ncbi:MAG TPA: TMEM175 family protein [Thermoanaerobaculia bacterium]|nr:TMEM175 family protein [Thermoanaerobaculia bacterium]